MSFAKKLTMFDIDRQPECFGYGLCSLKTAICKYKVYDWRIEMIIVYAQ